MKRFLLFVMMCVCVSIGAWAQGVSVTNSTWNPQQNTGISGTENVAVITVSTPGSLSSASIPSGVTMLRIKGELNDADITALGSLSYTTIDLQDAYYMDNSKKTAFTFTNSTVQNLILPDDWTRDEVNAAAIQCSSLHSAFSHGTFESFGPSITAYVKECGTLIEAIAHSSYEGEKNYKLRTQGLDYYQLDRLKKVTISGYPSARDYFGNGGTGATTYYTADGHLKYSPAPIENDSQTRTRVGDYTLLGALDGASLISLDLEKAVISSEYNEDLIFMDNKALGATAREFVIPTDPSVDTLPADFMSNRGGNENGIGQICIPANIKIIKTRAFLKSYTIDHIWTTSSDPNSKVDNGYCMGYDDHGEEIMAYGMRPLTGSKWDFQWGTYTLPPALELIETAAFGGKAGDDARVRDVYSLNEIAPECHVDAFHATMYHGNNNFSSSRISEDGIVTREAYGITGTTGTNWKTMLHYPRTTGTPSIQRYTDPTREYSIVTGDVDGNGSPIYFPDQSEIARAYMQGTFGYVWNAWDPTRTSDGSRAWVNPGVFGSYGIRNGYDSDSQADANDMWAANTVTPENPHIYTSFYDVTDGGNYVQPTGLEYYYNVRWDGNTLGTTSGTPLYPSAVTEPVLDEHGVVVTEERPERNPDGSIKYSPAGDGATWEGNYVAYTTEEYVKDNEGNFYRQVLPRNYDASKPKPWYRKESQQVASQDGLYIWTQTIGDQYNYTAASTWLTWGHTEEELAEKRAGGWTFNFEDKYVQDNNNGDYYLSSDYSTYSEGAPNFVSGISGPFRKKEVIAYRPATNGDSGPFYKMDMETVQVTKVVKANDYRGWHQFVLNGYSANTRLVMEPLKLYVKDNDWWTICAPYDLRYTDMMKLFGSVAQDHKPYLSKLLYVVRDVQNQKITLMFSKNLMEYMEYEMNGSDKRSINDANNLQTPGTYVHGIVDDTRWSAEDLAKNPIILHAGVPYLIKPYLDDITMRQFDIYKNTQPAGLTVPVGKNVIKDDWLYESLRKSRNLTPEEQLSLIYKGEYQVPAYVINNTAGEGTQDSKEITMNEGPSFNYTKSSTDNPFTFKNKEYTDMMVSSEYSYTFVGSLYQSVMPQFSYFLGWDSSKNRAAFWYNKVQDASKLTWNNGTGVICPNWKLDHEITPAKTEPSLRAAQWDAVVGTDITSDDIKGSVVGAKGFMDMEFGNSMLLSFEDDFGIATSVQELHNTNVDETVYDIHGVKVGTSLRGLAKGVYIMNGKKFVVK